MGKIRVRFAPSPTGPLHIGGVRTALYNYLFARNNKGDFVLRIEDTDQARLVDGAEEYIFETLNWLGLTPDESIRHGGSYGPYKQSLRKDLYAQYAHELIVKGKAYYAFDKPEELETMRERLKAEGSSHQHYNYLSRQQMRNSLTLDDEETQMLLNDGTPAVVRIKMSEKQTILVHDLVRGEISVDSSTLDDKVILKSDGMPTYHLANVVDDHLMEISHVIRGEEWLPSTPLHVFLYQALDWEDSIPKFVHLPLLLKPEGSGKLSKRDADQHGYPVFPLTWTDPESGNVSQGFREQGYLPEAVINFLALLGWNPGDERELFSLEELIGEFSIERVGKSGTQYNIDKAKWFNQHYLKTLKPEELANLLMQHRDITKEKALQIVDLMIERITFPSDLWEQAPYFYSAPDSYDEKMIRKKWKPEILPVLNMICNELEDTEPFNADTVKSRIEGIINQQGSSFGSVMPALRLCLTGGSGGPDLINLISVLGSEETVSRIKKALNLL